VHFVEAEAVRLAERAQLSIASALANNAQFHEEVRLKILSSDTDSAEHVALEKALKRVASGDLAGGGKMFRDWFQRDQVLFLAALDEAKTGRRKQRKNAVNSRPDGLQSLIMETMRRSPKITARGLWTEFQRLYDAGERTVVQDISGSVVTFATKSGQLKDAPISGLKDRMSRARKALKSP
jgi:hypothetical protein